MVAFENPDFLALPEPAGALFAGAGRRSFFAQPIWYHVLARYGIDNDGAVRLYLDDRERPRAGLVCRVTGGQASPSPGRHLASLANFYSCEHGPILGGDVADAPAALARIAREIAGERPRWDSLMLAGLDPADPGYAGLAEAFRGAGMAVHSYADAGCWYEETTGLSFPDYLAGRPSPLRNTWRRKSTKLEASGRARLTFHDDARALEDGIAAYEAVYRASWKGGEPFPDFMPALMRAAAQLDALRLGLLDIEGEPAAAQVWIVWQGRACIYKLAHDGRFDALSPGTLLTMRMMKRVLERDRPSEVNFGRGDDPYKKLWLPRRRERRGLVIANPRTVRGLVLTLRQTAGTLVRRLRAPARAAADLSEGTAT